MTSLCNIQQSKHPEARARTLHNIELTRSVPNEDNAQLKSESDGDDERSESAIDSPQGRGPIMKRPAGPGTVLAVDLREDETQLDTFNALVLESLRRFYSEHDPSMVDSIPDAVAMLGGNPKNFALLCSNLEAQYGSRPIDAMTMEVIAPFDEQALNNLTEFYAEHDKSMVDRVPDIVVMLARTPDMFAMLCDNLEEQYGKRPRAIQTHPRSPRAGSVSSSSSASASPQNSHRFSTQLHRFIERQNSYTSTGSNSSSSSGSSSRSSRTSSSSSSRSSSVFTTATNARSRRSGRGHSSHVASNSEARNSGADASDSSNNDDVRGRHRRSARNDRRLAAASQHLATSAELGEDADASNTEESENDVPAPVFVKRVMSTLRKCVEAHEEQRNGGVGLEPSEWKAQLQELARALDTLQYAGNGLGLPDQTLDMLEEQIKAMMTTIEENYLAAESSPELRSLVTAIVQDEAIGTEPALPDEENEDSCDNASLSSAASEGKHIRRLETRVKELEAKQVRLQREEEKGFDSESSDDAADTPFSRYSEAVATPSAATNDEATSAAQTLQSMQMYDVAIQFVERAHETLRLCAEAHAAVVAGAEDLTPEQWQPHLSALNSHLDAVQSGSLPLPKSALKMLESRLSAMIALVEDTHINGDIQSRQNEHDDDSGVSSAADLFLEVKSINQQLRDPANARFLTRERLQKFLKRISRLVQFLATDAMNEKDEHGLAVITPILLPQLSHMTEVVKGRLQKAPHEFQQQGAVQNKAQSKQPHQTSASKQNQIQPHPNSASQSKTKVLSSKRSSARPRDSDLDDSDLDGSPTHVTDSIFLRGIRNALALCKDAHEQQVMGKAVTKEAAWETKRVQLQLYLGDLRDEAQNVSATVLDELEDSLESMIGIIEEHYLSARAVVNPSPADHGYNPRAHNDAALLLQSMFRGARVRKRKTRETEAAIVAQKAYRGSTTRRKLWEERDKRNSVANHFEKQKQLLEQQENATQLGHDSPTAAAALATAAGYHRAIESEVGTAEHSGQSSEPVTLSDSMEIDQLLEWLDYVFGDPSSAASTGSEALRSVSPGDWKGIHQQLQHYVAASEPQQDKPLTKVKKYLRGKSMVYLRLIGALIAANEAVANINGKSGGSFNSFSLSAATKIAEAAGYKSPPRDSSNSTLALPAGAVASESEISTDCRAEGEDQVMEHDVKSEQAATAAAVEAAVIAQRAAEERAAAIARGEVHAGPLRALVDTATAMLDKPAGQLSEREVNALVAHIEASYSLALEAGLDRAAPVSTDVERTLSTLSDRIDEERLRNEAASNGNSVDRAWLETAGQHDTAAMKAEATVLAQVMFDHYPADVSKALANVAAPSGVATKSAGKEVVAVDTSDSIDEQTLLWGARTFGEPRFRTMYKSDPQLWTGAAAAAAAADRVAQHKEAALVLQRMSRTWSWQRREKARQDMKRKHAAAAAIQASHRSKLHRQQFTRARQGAVALQSKFRQQRARQEYDKLLARARRPHALPFKKLLKLKQGSFYKQQLRKFLFEGDSPASATTTKIRNDLADKHLFQRKPPAASNVATKATPKPQNAAPPQRQATIARSRPTASRSSVSDRVHEQNNSRYSVMIWEHRVLASTMKLQRWLRACWANEVRRLEEQILEQQNALKRAKLRQQQQAVLRERQRAAKLQREFYQRQSNAATTLQRHVRRMQSETRYQDLKAEQRAAQKARADVDDLQQTGQRPKAVVSAAETRREAVTPHVQETVSSPQAPRPSNTSQTDELQRESKVSPRRVKEASIQVTMVEKKKKSRPSVDLSQLPSVPGQITVPASIFRPGTISTPRSEVTSSGDEHGVGTPSGYTFAMAVRQCNKINKWYALQGHNFRIFPVNGSGGSALMYKPLSPMHGRLGYSPFDLDEKNSFDDDSFGAGGPPASMPRRVFEAPLHALALAQSEPGHEHEVSVFVYSWKSSLPMFLGDKSDRGEWVLHQRIGSKDLKSEYFKVVGEWKAHKSRGSRSSRSSSKERKTNRQRKSRSTSKRSAGHVYEQRSRKSRSHGTKKRSSHNHRQRTPRSKSSRGNFYREELAEAAAVAAIDEAAAAGAFGPSVQNRTRHRSQENEYRYPESDEDDLSVSDGQYELRERLHRLSSKASRAGQRRSRLHVPSSHTQRRGRSRQTISPTSDRSDSVVVDKRH